MSTMTDAVAAIPVDGDVGGPGSDRLAYRAMVERLHRLIAATVPAGATVAVISKGDPELVQLGSRIGWHFPQQEDGEYAGFHPYDSAAAAEALDRIRAKGAQFLLIPATALWWLEHYKDFAAHLARRYRVVARDEPTGILLALHEKAVRESPAAVARAQAHDHLARQLRGLVDSLLPPDATILVATGGDAALAELGKRLAWPFPQDADGGTAIIRLEELRRSGAQFLVIPTSELCWLDVVPDFGRHLEASYPAVVRQRHVCTIFDLSGQQ
jgi:hypothetical protein